MTKQPKTFTAHEKARVAMTALKGEKTIAQISSDFGVHPTQIGLWKKQVIQRLPELFTDTNGKQRQQDAERQQQIEQLYRIIGQRDCELEWLKKKMAFFQSG